MSDPYATKDTATKDETNHDAMTRAGTGQDDHEDYEEYAAQETPAPANSAPSATNPPAWQAAPAYEEPQHAPPASHNTALATAPIPGSQIETALPVLVWAPKDDREWNAQLEKYSCRIRRSKRNVFTGVVQFFDPRGKPKKIESEPFYSLSVTQEWCVDRVHALRNGIQVERISRARVALISGLIFLVIGLALGAFLYEVVSQNFIAV